MKKIKLIYKEKELAEVILWNMHEKIKDYDYKIEVKKNKYIFTFKQKKLKK